MFNLDVARVLDQFAYNPDAKLLFHSGFFIFLFIGFVAVYRILLPHQRARILWTTCFSLYFYYKCAGWFWLLHILLVVVDFNLARWMEAMPTKRKKQLLLLISLVVNLGMLAYFKYNVYSELWCELSGNPFDPSKVFLPVGISFFTFQSLSYTIDVYRGQLKALHSILDYAFYVTFFPQMVAGPIVRASDFLPQINKPVIVTREDFGRGIFLICIGLFKKAVISDYISANFVDRVFDSPLQYTGMENLFAVYGYALQIYCDFSGYSDMAIGIALLLGFKFNINFDAPYQSSSITEFWRRWHISLSTWLRDYLYIPLGGNRLGKLRTYVNLMITMLLGGLWHGAAIRFIIWGGMHGLALSFERLIKPFFGSRGGAIRKVIGVVLTFHFVCFCWIFFRAQGMDNVLAMISQIWYNFESRFFLDFVTGYSSIVTLMAIGYLLHFLPRSLDSWAERQVARMPVLGKALVVALIAALVMQVKSSEVQPFIYFQF
ncbi:MAG: MBOAT family protein [Lewinellaceae bacterium]|nr:MBOAT family protein [Saprospiraceae bacterium]MCB9345683.1 MBOAT family protein [Lewinellaceae bacterium]